MDPMKRIPSILVFCLVVLVLALCSCQPMVFASSESPDRKYRCEVYQGSPSLLWGRNYRYYFSLEKIGLPRLEGEDFEFVSEKQLRVEDIKFEWSGQHLKVTIDAPPVTVVAVGNAGDREQHWTRQ
jgi:hypothetical protein